MSVLPDEGVRERLARHEQDAVLPCEVADREADIRQISACQQIDVVPAHELLCRADRDAGFAFVVPADDLQLAPEKAAFGVELLDSQLPAATIGQGECGRAAIGVDLADPDRSRALCTDDAGRKHRHADAAQNLSSRDVHQSSSGRWSEEQCRPKGIAT